MCSLVLFKNETSFLPFANRTFLWLTLVSSWGVVSMRAHKRQLFFHFLCFFVALCISVRAGVSCSFNFSYLPSLSVSFHTSLPGKSSSLEFKVPTTIQREKQIRGQSVCQEPWYQLLQKLFPSSVSPLRCRCLNMRCWRGEMSFTIFRDRFIHWVLKQGRHGKGSKSEERMNERWCVG